jgi:hypothetical protein
MSDVFGWLSFVAIVAAAVVGIALRRARHPPEMLVRMRPHFVLGYIALASALAHLAALWRYLKVDDSLDLKFAIAALVALAAQTLVGFALSRRIRNRRFVRAWHISTTAVLCLATLAHVMAGGAL